MKSKCPIKDNMAYLASRMLHAESAIFSCGCGGFSPLEQHPPGSFVHCVEEFAKGLVLCRIKLPQLKPRCWQGRIRRTSMTWITLTRLSFLFTRVWRQDWSPVSSSELPRRKPFSFQEVSCMGVPYLNSAAAAHLG